MSRTSLYGFFCAHCNKFTYIGYDSRDKKELPKDSAVCLECGDYYEDVEIKTERENRERMEK